MNEGSGEQSMEDILASIKRVISADADAARSTVTVSVDTSPDDDAPEDVLELGEPPLPAHARDVADDDGEPLVSEHAAVASKAALAALATLSIDPRADANTLDGLVRELLRPMLKDWLDANLAQIVERIVAREVARVVGR